MLTGDDAFCFHCGFAVAAAAPTAMPAPSPGPAVSLESGESKSFAAGRYAVQCFLGEGGKKRVYLVHDTKLDREVAFSLIKTDGLDAVGVERIVRGFQEHNVAEAHRSYPVPALIDAGIVSAVVVESSVWVTPAVAAAGYSTIRPADARLASASGPPRGEHTPVARSRR